MAKELLRLEKGTSCTSWNYSATRLAAASLHGTLSIFDLSHPPFSSLRSVFNSKVHEVNIVKIVWVPPEYGDAVACVSADGIVSLWEEVAQASQPLQWKICKSFGNSSSKVLDVQFGISCASLKMVAAYSDGNVRVFELSDPLELGNWQLQAEFQNVIESVSAFGKALCLSASISWNSQKGGSQESSFLIGFNSNTPELNSSKVWEFDQAHQRWLPVAELALPEDKGDQVYAVAWAPNIGRSYEIIAVATHKGLAIWHIGLNADHNGRLPVERVALLSGHEGMVWQMEWDMSGMTLATTGQDGMVRLWQCNLNGVWHQQAAFEPTCLPLVSCYTRLFYGENESLKYFGLWKEG